MGPFAAQVAGVPEVLANRLGVYLKSQYWSDWESAWISADHIGGDLVVSVVV